MQLQGKCANFLGDSITYGVGTDVPAEMFVNVVAKALGLAEARNYGISGSRIARQHGPDTCPWPYCDRVDSMAAEADLIVVFGGTNDYGHGDAPFGQFSDRTGDTFYGALHQLCCALQARYPLAEIVFLTPVHRADEEKNAATGLPLVAYVNAILEVCAYYAIPVLDLYRTSTIQPQHPRNRALLCPDGLHPNALGNARIASRLVGFLQSL